MNHTAERLCDVAGKPARIQKNKTEQVNQEYSVSLHTDTVSLHMPQPRGTVTLCAVIDVSAVSH